MASEENIPLNLDSPPAGESSRKQALDPPPTGGRKPKGIGITAYAWDFSGSMFGSAVYGFPSAASSYANNAQCGASGFGPGKILQIWYQTGGVPAALE